MTFPEHFTHINHLQSALFTVHIRFATVEGFNCGENNMAPSNLDF